VDEPKTSTCRNEDEENVDTDCNIEKKIMGEVKEILMLVSGDGKTRPDISKDIEAKARKLRKRLECIARIKKAKNLHGTCGVKRFLSELEWCGKESAPLEDRRGRTLKDITGSKTCPRDIQVILLVPESEREAYRQKLRGTDGVRFLRIGSVDAGERTCWTIFDIWNGCVFCIGDRFTREFMRKMYIPSAKIISELQSDKIKPKRRTKLELQLTKLRSMFARRQRALRKLSVNFITQMYDVYVKPKFEVYRMTRKSRRLSAEISSRMLSIGHGKFDEELRRVCEERNVFLDETTDERYSSKCCGKCEHIHASLGASKTFECPHCDNVEERGTYT
jgi:hypothetical protein